VKRLFLDNLDLAFGRQAQHCEMFANYFISRQTSGSVEGFNNKVKVLKRR